MSDEHQDDQNFHEEDEELREMVEKALKQSIKDKKTFKRRQDLAHRISNIIAEYLDSYILLGFDPALKKEKSMKLLYNKLWLVE